MGWPKRFAVRAAKAANCQGMLVEVQIRRELTMMAYELHT